MTCATHYGSTLPANVKCCERIGVCSLKSYAEVRDTKFRGFENSITSDSPRVLTPKAVAAKGISRANSNESAILSSPEPCDVFMTRAARHNFASQRPGHGEAKID